MKNILMIFKITLIVQLILGIIMPLPNILYVYNFYNDADKISNITLVLYIILITFLLVNILFYIVLLIKRYISFKENKNFFIYLILVNFLSFLCFLVMIILCLKEYGNTSFDIIFKS